MTRRAGVVGVVVLAAATLATHLFLVSHAPWQDRTGLFRMGVAAAAAVCGLAAWLASRLPGGRAGVFAVTLVAGAAHCLWLFAPVTLSDDLVRYVYEGALVREGVSPYTTTPIERGATEVGHAELSSCYPPLSLAVFSVAGVGGPIGLRIVFAIASVWTTFLLGRCLARAGQPPLRAAAYGWAPLPAIEFAGSGHHDAVGVLLLVAALAGLEKRAGTASGIAWAASAGIKGISLVTLPAFWRRWGRRERLAALFLTTAFLLPLAATLVPAHSGTSAYVSRWEHNDVAFAGLRLALGDPGVARVVAVVLLVLACGIGGRSSHAARAAMGAIAAALFLAPSFHPWYATWILALAPLAGSPAAWVLAQTVLWTYAIPGVQSTPGFAPVPWGWSAAVWAPALLLWAVEWTSSRGRRTGG